MSEELSEAIETASLFWDLLRCLLEPVELRRGGEGVESKGLSELIETASWSWDFRCCLLEPVELRRGERRSGFGFGSEELSEGIE